MSIPPRLISEASNHLPVLILDEEGSFGLAIAYQLHKHLQVVLIGEKEPIDTKNILHLPCKRNHPTIPSDNYSHIFFIATEKNHLEDFFEGLLAKAKEDNGVLMVCILPHLADKQTLEKFHSSYDKLHVVILPDVFDNKLFFKKYSIVETFFYQAKTKRAIDLVNTGLGKVYPVLFSDALISLLKIAFDVEDKEKIIYLFPKFPATKLSLSHALQKIDPLLKIDFKKEEVKEHEPWISPNAYYAFDENYPVFEKIQEAYKKISVPKEEEIKNKNREVVKKEDLFFERPVIGKKKKKKTSPFLLICIFVLLLVLLPLVTTVSFGLSGVENLLNAKVQIQKGETFQAEEAFLNASYFFSLARQTNYILVWEASLIGLQEKVGIVDNLLVDGQTVSVAGSDVLSSISVLSQVAKGIAPFPKPQLNEALDNIKSAYASVQELLLDSSTPKELKNMLRLQMLPFTPLVNLLEVVPDMVGMNGKKTYLVLFQNNMELRPGGGFIGSYGLLTLDSGRVTDFSIHDVYDADGQLKGHVEPPFPIRRFMGIVHLYLRDSNFDVDFQKDGYTAAFMLKLETGQKVDGVIGVDLSFVKNLVAGVGGVYVPEYNQTVTADNMFLLTESHAEKNFFPGSTQKKDFLESLFASLKDKLLKNSGINYQSVLSESIQSLEEKHILFSLADPSIQDIFTVNGFSSSLWDNRIASKDMLVDFSGVNEANIGVNKVNYYITRQESEEINFQKEGKVSETTTLEFTNTSTGWPGGDYKNYLRFILPENTQLSSVAINGKPQTIVAAITSPTYYEAKGFTPPDGLEVQREDEEGKTIYGFLVNVSPGQTQTIQVSYNLAQGFDPMNPLFDYSLKLFKEPGIDSFPDRIILHYPNSLKVITTTINGVIEPQATDKMTLNLNSDTILDFKLATR